MMQKGVILVFLFSCLVSVAYSQKEWMVIIEEIKPFPQLNINAGDSVRWVNQDTNNFIYKIGGDDFESEDLAYGDEFVQTFSSSGQFTYLDLYHPITESTINVFENLSFSFFPDVEFSPLPNISPLDGYSFSLISSVSTIFSGTPGVFGFEESPEARALSPNYFLSPGELSSAAFLYPSTLLIVALFALYL